MKRISQSPADPAFMADPYPFYERARALGEIVFWEEYGMPVATTMAAAQAVLKDRRMGREAPVAPQVPGHLTDFYAIEAHSMLELEPPRHTRLRGLVLRAFTSREIKGREGEIREVAARLASVFPEGPFDLVSAFAQPLPVLVIARLLGVPEARADDLLRWSNAMVGMYQAGRSRADEDAANAAARDFAGWLGEVIAERRKSPGESLIDRLIAAEEEGERLTGDELVTTIILLLNAGHEATVHSIGNGVRAILEHGAAEAARTAPAQLAEEVLRYDPPLHLFTRHVYEDVDVAGITLEKGSQVAALLASANRDPAVFDRSERFDPRRVVGQTAAFGSGIHFCVGAPLARLELGIAFETLCARWPDLRLAAEPEIAPIYHFRGLKRLMVER
ncbi:cytochrome P450 [Tropicimonas sp. IMCC34011]|uniref:cytochrome P450 n=1 Tax=Tropicimonas sp. IMCC34011 TaxID=2248759 RepID=UPI000E265FB1|nr:cytochrome P450 [Tropicimonas sp. IMCC34011]